MKMLPNYFIYKHNPTDYRCIVVLNWINTKFNTSFDNVSYYFGANLQDFKPLAIPKSMVKEYKWAEVNVCDIYELVKTTKKELKYSIY